MENKKDCFSNRFGAYWDKHPVISTISFVGVLGVCIFSGFYISGLSKPYDVTNRLDAFTSGKPYEQFIEEKRDSLFNRHFQEFFNYDLNNDGTVDSAEARRAINIHIDSVEAGRVFLYKYSHVH